MTKDVALSTLAMVGRMYLNALDADPENEMLALPEALMVQNVRDAVAYVAEIAERRA